MSRSRQRTKPIHRRDRLDVESGGGAGQADRSTEQGSALTCRQSPAGRLAREVYHLKGEGVVSVADVDTGLCWGPGLRWGIMDQVQLSRPDGGQGGMEHLLAQFADPLTA